MAKVSPNGLLVLRTPAPSSHGEAGDQQGVAREVLVTGIGDLGLSGLVEQRRELRIG